MQSTNVMSNKKKGLEQENKSNRDKNDRIETFAEQDDELVLNIARSTLGYLAMDDKLKKRMELAFGEIRILGDTSNVTKISEKNKRQVEEFELAFSALKVSISEPRELEILAEKLVDICVDIISSWRAKKQV
jgi:hypothetical protein